MIETEVGGLRLRLRLEAKVIGYELEAEAIS